MKFGVASVGDPQSAPSSRESPEQLLQNMAKANQLESPLNRSHRYQSVATLLAFLELFKCQESLKQIPKVAGLQNVLLALLSSADSKNQKLALDCLTKTGYNRGLLVKYAKLLEGFCDDEKFKDMIPILGHGSQARAGDADAADEPQLDGEGGEDDKL